MYVGHKLKSEKADKTVTKLAEHLAAGEQVIGIAICNNMRPLVDRLVVTDRRLLATLASDGTPKWESTHVLLLDVVSNPKKQTFAVHTTDGREQVFKLVRAEDHGPLLELLNLNREHSLAGTGLAEDVRKDLAAAAAVAKVEAAAPTPVQQLAIDQGFPAKHRALVEPLLALLDTAVDASARGDVVAEERAIWDGKQLANKAGLVAISGPKWFEDRLLERTQRGELRRGVDLLGVVGTSLTIMSDRVLQKDKAYVLDADVRASVEVNGQVLESSRPTMTRMAIGSVLPGSALLVGMAVPKKTTEDKRTAMFVLVHPKWRIIEHLNPDTAHQLTGLAAQIMAVAGSLQRREARIAPVTSGDSSPNPRVDLSKVADEIAKLASLRDAGVLTEDEFASAKARLLN